MKQHFYRVLVFVTAIVGTGFSAPLLADAGQFKLDMILAERGDPDAQYYVANAYEEGRGTQPDIKQAFEWYNKAAAQQHAAAQYKLGVMYENGQGVEQDLKQAMEWYKQAADNGNTPARERLNKAAFARSEAVMKRRIAAMKEEQRREEQAEKQRRAEEQKRRQEQAERARQAALREQQARGQLAQQQQVAAASPRSTGSRQAGIPDLTELVVNNKWQEDTQPADFLPSASTHCLSPSETELVCFSGEKQRIINGMRITYTAKATLTDFKSDGSFQVRYNYNVLKMESAGTQGLQRDPHGLKLEAGWQEPQLVAHCQTRDRTNLYCQRGNSRLHYQR